MTKSNRRSFIGKGVAASAAVTAAAAVPAAAQSAPVRKVYYEDGKKPDKPQMYNSVVTYGNLVFIAGVGAHFDGDIRAHTKHVLDEIQKKLESCGSSMNKVLKANVYLNDLKDRDAMGKEFLGRFGDTPPVRTTIAAPGGIPGNSLVEIDVIAFI